MCDAWGTGGYAATEPTLLFVYFSSPNPWQNLTGHTHEPCALPLNETEARFFKRQCQSSSPYLQPQL